MSLSKRFNIILYTNSEGLDTSNIANVHRLPMIRALSRQLNGIGNVLVVLRYISPMQQPSKVMRRLRCTQLHQPFPNMFTWVPWVPWNISIARRSPFLLSVFRHCLRRSLRRAMRIIGFDNEGDRVAWLTHPYHMFYRGIVGEKFTTYECYDDFTLFNSGKINGRLKTIERSLVCASDLILATSQKLFQRHKEDNANTHYFPNAVEFELFDKANDPATQVAEQLLPIPKPIIGFMGNLSDWYDFSLLLKLIIIRPQWSFVFVGEVASNVREVVKMKQYQNVFLLGWQEYETLPNILKGINVAIMPYKMNRFMQSVNPNKMYQFMAAGVPIVSTPIPEVLRFSDVISIARDATDFARQIESCLDQQNSSRRERMISLASKESWDERVKMVLNLIKEGLEIRKVL